MGLRPPLRPIGQIEILEPRLAIRRIERLLERGVEFSLLIDAVDDGGSTLVQFAQIPQPLLERTQLGVIERSSCLLAVAGARSRLSLYMLISRKWRRVMGAQNKGWDCGGSNGEAAVA